MSKNILITGIGNGIGKEIAKLYVKQGHIVIGLDYNQKSLDSLKVEIPKIGELFLCDLSKPERINTFESISQKYSFDIVIANAGVGGINPGYSFDTGLNRKFFEVNYFSVIDLINIFSKKMRKKKKGQFVTVSSLASIRGMPQAASYSSSKSALNKTVESFRVDLKNDGIIFTNVLPGFIKTNMTNHQEFEMPFMISVDKAARLISKAIKNKKHTYSFPISMKLLSLVNMILPSKIFTLIMHKFASKENKVPKTF
ncbi:MAG: hypothetical protein CME61_01455 [Halobacteriovoraceae bacterium]|nr:hypothetical protein [Halobacteriovoraceae bacterium]